jgi:hypothetical protein
MSRNKNLVVILLVATSVFLYKFVFSSQDEGGFLDKIRDKDIKSIVSKKYIDYDNHNIAFLVYNKDCIVIYRDWWDKVSVGDSILKPKGSLEVVIKNFDKIEKFDYEDK